jgi:flagellar biosynthesis/type III secretory pathway protein FliH
VSYLLWQRGGDARIASPRLVLRAAELPLLNDALVLRDTLDRLRRDQDEILAAATAQARERGHAQGTEEGRREAAEQVAATLTALGQAAAHERDRLRGEVGALALQVVRKLLGNFTEDTVLAALAATAANDLLATQPVALVVHPELCQAVRDRLAAGAAAADGKPALRCEVRGDPACPRDTCHMETEHGSVDASLEAQLARLETAWRAQP